MAKCYSSLPHLWLSQCQNFSQKVTEDVQRVRNEVVSELNDLKLLKTEQLHTQDVLLRIKTVIL